MSYFILFNILHIYNNKILNQYLKYFIHNTTNLNKKNTN